MKVIRVELMIIDFDGLGEDGVRQELECARYANDCISPHVVSSGSRDIGEWSDEHPLNHELTSLSEFRRLFS